MDDVDLALVLAFDASASVSFDEFVLMTRGCAGALRDEFVQAGLLGGPLRASLVSLVLWSGPGAQEVMVDWTRIATPAGLKDFAQAVEDVPRIVPAGTTAIGEALLLCRKLLAAAPATARRQVIDLVGDGRSNAGPDPAPVRDLLVEAGVTINGLCVLHEEPDLVESYTRDVIGGPGSFALWCQDYSGFADAMRQKLTREIARARLSGARAVPG
jgi:Ca-activated chloride channel family protein